MQWYDAQDADGFPARYATFGPFVAYLTGEYRKDTRTMHWCGLFIMRIADLDRLEVIPQYRGDPLYQNWGIVDESIWDAPPEAAERAAVPYIRQFIDERVKSLQDEIAELATVRP